MRNRFSALVGLILVVIGAWFLAVQLVPDLDRWWQEMFSWPWLVIGVGVLLLIIGLLGGAPGMAVPAAIIGGIGGLLYWQYSTGNWESWVYAWTLIPGFVGVGVILAGLLEGTWRPAVRGGGTLIVISIVLFAIFGSFLGGPISLGIYWPVVLIVLGVWFLLGPALRGAPRSVGKR